MDGTLNLAIHASYVLEICSNFLVVDHSGYVHFAHLSVPEYLKGGRSAIVFSDIDAHAQIAEICLAYVMSPSAQKIVKETAVSRRFRRFSDGSELGQTDTTGIISAVEVSSSEGSELNWIDSRQESLEIAIPTADPDRGPLGFHSYAFALCLEHCELASMVKRQEGTLCRLFTAFMSIGEINAAFLTWLQRKPYAHRFAEDPENWTAQIHFSHYQTKGAQLRDDLFLAACVYGFTEILQDMRSIENVNVDRRIEWHLSGLRLAIKYGHLSVVELLLDERAYSNINDSLSEAVDAFHPEIVALLLSRGADASARLTTKSFFSRELIDGKTLLHVVARSNVGSIKESMVSSVVSLLLEHGVPIDATDSALRTALHDACDHDNILVVSVLLHHGAFPGARDINGSTPLMTSFPNRSTTTIELLLKKASIADIVRHNNDGHSVLLLSLNYNALDVTMLLLNTVDLRAARELGTQEGDEFVELSQVLKRIGYVVLRREWRQLRMIAFEVRSQRSVINCLRAVADKIDLGKLDWDDADLGDKLREEGLNWVC